MWQLLHQTTSVYYQAFRMTIRSSCLKTDGIVAINGSILTLDLKKLASNKWLNLAILQGFVDLLNNYHSETASMVLNNLLAFNKADNFYIESHICGNQVCFITFIINIGRDFKETFMASSEEPGCTLANITVCRYHSKQVVLLLYSGMGSSNGSCIHRERHPWSIINWVAFGEKTSPREVSCSQPTKYEP